MTGSKPERPTAEMGPWTATHVVISSIIGVGILTTSGTISASLGSHQLMLIVWALGGLVALCGALGLAEVASTYPAPGGEYAILHRAYGPTAAFLYGWATLLVGFAAPIAASAATAAIYLTAPLGLPDIPRPIVERAVACGIILVFTLIQARGRRGASAAQNSVTIAETVFLLLFIVLGLIFGRHGWANLADRPTLDRSTLSASAYALVFVAYGYTGWNSSVYLAAEVRDPGRTLPISILGGTIAVTVLYLGINTVYALAIPATTLREMVESRGENAVVPIAELAARALFGDGVGAIFSIAAGLMLAAMVSAYVMTGPRIMQAMAAAGQLPASLGRVSRRGVPIRSSIWLAAGSLLFLFTGTFDQVVVYAGVGLTLMSILSGATVILLRVRDPHTPRPFRVPGYPYVPLVHLVGSIALVVGATVEAPLATLTSMLTILAGLPLQRVLARNQLAGRVGDGGADR